MSKDTKLSDVLTFGELSCIIDLLVDVRPETPAEKLAVGKIRKAYSDAIKASRSL